MSGGRRISAVAVLALALATGSVLAFLLIASGEVRAVEFYGADIIIAYHSALLTGLLALPLAAALVLRGGGRAYTHALALCLVSLALGMLLLLLIFVPSLEDSGLLKPVLLSSLLLIPAALLLGTGAFLRFAVLFPRPLSVAEVRRLGSVRAGDSLGRLDRLVARLVRSRAHSSPPAGWLDRLIRPFPQRLQRVARLEVVTDGGRLVTEPRLLWGTVAALAAVPALLALLLEVLPERAGISIPPDHPVVWAGALLVFLVLIAIPTGLLLGIALLRLGYGLAPEADRRRMRWIVETVNMVVWGAVAMAPFVLLLALGVRSPIIELAPSLIVLLMPVIVVTGLAVAVFYDGALDPSLVVRKSTMYGLFGFGLAFLFGVVEELVTEYVATALGLPDGSGTLVASGAIAVIVGVFHGRLRRVADRVMPGRSPTAQAHRPVDADG